MRVRKPGAVDGPRHTATAMLAEAAAPVLSVQHTKSATLADRPGMAPALRRNRTGRAGCGAHGADAGDNVEP
jgi:hypothetical protein